MTDIAPQLLEELQSAFREEIGNNSKIKALYAVIQGGNATYIDAEEYAYEVGKALAIVFSDHLSSAVLPEGQMFYNIAERVIRPLLEEDHDLVSDAATTVQQMLNRKAGLGIKAQTVPVNADRIDGIINRVSSAAQYDDVTWILGEPIIAFSQSVVEEVLKANVDFQGKSGLRPKIIRKAEHKCCEWCSNLEGEYQYPEVPEEVYRRHQRCRCTVDYDPGEGKKYRNVHSKQWKDANESAKIEARKKVGLGSKITELPADKEKRIIQENGLGLADRIADHPQMLQAYTPKGLKSALERAGYEVNALGRGRLKGVAFEDGGGYRVNFGGDRILQYHPAEGSHHEGEYYKISSGKGGTRRYDRKGNEKSNHRES